MKFIKNWWPIFLAIAMVWLIYFISSCQKDHKYIKGLNFFSDYPCNVVVVFDTDHLPVLMLWDADTGTIAPPSFYHLSKLTDRKEKEDLWNFYINN